MEPTARTSARRPAPTNIPAPGSFSPRNQFSVEDEPLPGEQDQDFLPLLAHPLPVGRLETLGRPRW